MTVCLSAVHSMGRQQPRVHADVKQSVVCATEAPIVPKGRRVSSQCSVMCNCCWGALHILLLLFVITTNMSAFVPPRQQAMYTKLYPGRSHHTLRSETNATPLHLRRHTQHHTHTHEACALEARLSISPADRECPKTRQSSELHGREKTTRKSDQKKRESEGGKPKKGHRRQQESKRKR